MKLIPLQVLFCCALSAASTTVLFNPTSTTAGPFPSNAVTVSDSTQETNLRVQLPSSNDCVTNAAQSVCSNTSLLNQLDGFSVNSRIMVCFSAPINTGTLQSAINILPLSGGSAIPVNQVVYDPNSNCAFAKPNQVLNQQSQYLLVVSGTIQDATGKLVSPDPAFASCLASNTGYCQTLAQAISAAAAPLASLKATIVSLFTTMSATVWVQNAHAYIAANPPGAA